ncbi:MAG TPA: flagellar basal body-associated FliL family protein [Geminicoccaceae bacterium]|nr:flagellar basal body-associated FliL family protein [Geminicoccaceae bacterium]
MAGKGKEKEEVPAVDPPAAGKRKGALLIAAAALLLAGGGGGAAAYFAGLFGGSEPAEAATGHGVADDADHAGAGSGAHAGDEATPAVAFIDMPDLIVNLRSDAPRMRYLKLRVSLEVDGEPAADAVRQLMPRVMDGFQLYLRALSVDEVSGAAGMQRLKEELIARVNLAVRPVQVNDVLLKEILVQ